MAYRVGLTGNIASGKSAVADVWRRLGAAVVDADDLARRAVEPGTPGLRRVAERFGAGVLRADGSLDRDALRRIVFDDAAQRAELERILHPDIAKLRSEEEERLAHEGIRVVVHVIPLLFEVGLKDVFDTVVVVDAPVDARLRRIVETRGLSVADARRMIGAQMPAEQKRSRADIVIDNSGTLPELEASAAETWREILRRAA